MAANTRLAAEQRADHKCLWSAQTQMRQLSIPHTLLKGLENISEEREGYCRSQIREDFRETVSSGSDRTIALMKLQELFPASDLPKIKAVNISAWR